MRHKKAAFLAFVTSGLLLCSSVLFAREGLRSYPNVWDVVTAAEQEEQNKEIVLYAMRALASPDIDFALENLNTYFPPDYIQHNPMVPNGPEVLRDFFILNRPDNFVFDISIALAEGDFVFDYRIFTSIMTTEPAIVAEVFRVKDGIIVEHWDLIEDEKLANESVNGNPMFPIVPTGDNASPITPNRFDNIMKVYFQESVEEYNKAVVTYGLHALFSKADPLILSAFWDTNLIQHNPNIDNGLGSLADYYANGQSNKFVYEPGFILADDDFVVAHSRLTGFGAAPILVFQIFRLENGKIVEQWEVTQEEVPVEGTVSGNPMFPIE